MNVLDNLTPEQLGERLRIARSGSSMTQETAATELGMSRTTLVAIERGQRRTKPEELIDFAKLYHTTVGRLVASDAIHVDLSAKFRRIEGKPQSPAVSEAIQLLNRLAAGTTELEQLLRVNRRFDYPPPVRIFSQGFLQQAEDAAVALRQRLGIGLGPISDLFTLMEFDLGIRVFVRPLRDGSISGLYAFDPAIGACVLVNANHPRRRRKQTLAHEAGHFVSDRSHTDVLDEEPVPLTTEERFARRFGPAFLMPAPALRDRYEQAASATGALDLRGLILLAHQFDVTTEAMTRRLEELGLLAAGSWASLRDRGFSSDLERQVIGDPEPPQAVPLLPSRVAVMASRALHQELLSEGQLCEMLVLDRVQLRKELAPFDHPEGLLGA